MGEPRELDLVGEEAHDQLQADPGAEVHPRGDLELNEEDRLEQLGAREAPQIGGHDPGDRSRGADDRGGGGEAQQHVQGAAGDAGAEKQDREAQAAEQVFDVVAEDVEEVRVEEDVIPAAVQELMRDQGVHGVVVVADDLAGDDGPVAIEHDALSLGDEQQQEAHQQQIDQPWGAARRVVDLDRQLRDDLRDPDRAASQHPLLEVLLALAGGAHRELAALGAVEPDAGAARAAFDRGPEHAGQLVLVHRAMAARAHARGEAGPERGELDRVDVAVAEHVELTAVEPRAETHRAGVEHDALAGGGIRRVLLGPSAVGLAHERHWHERVQTTRGTLGIDGVLRGVEGLGGAIHDQVSSSERQAGRVRLTEERGAREAMVRCA